MKSDRHTPSDARPLRPRVVARALALGALGLAAAQMWALDASRRTRPAIDARVRADKALVQARQGPAPRWAAIELREAETALASAGIEWALTSERVWPRRDFGPVADALWRAETLAWRAQRLAEERRAAARAEARDAWADAEDLMGHAELLARATALPAEQRVHLARARFLLDEARALEAEAEFGLAAQRSGAARDEIEQALGPVLAEARRYTSAERLATWARWVADTQAWSRASGRAALVVVKEKNLATLFVRGRPVASYPADIGLNAVADKLRAGDRATPEGRYRIVEKKDRGRSRYYRALLLDYPNQADRRRIQQELRAGRLPPGTSAGGLIEVHGEGGRGRNWTHGCVAVSNEHMDVLFERLGVGAWVTIVGGDGRDGRFSDALVRLGARLAGARTAR